MRRGCVPILRVLPTTGRMDHILRHKRVREKAFPDTETVTAACSSSQEDLHRRMDLVTAMRHVPLANRQVLTLMLEGFRHAEIE